MGKFSLPVEYSKLHWKDRKLVREQYVQEQKGLCYWCNFPLDKNPPDRILKKKINWKLFPPNFTKYPVHLQHSHTTGLTEGAVHARCNAVMWQYHNK